MENFSMFGYNFFITDVIKKSKDKSIFVATMKVDLKYEYINLNKEVVILKISKLSKREILFTSILSNPCIPKVLLVWEDKEHIYFVQEKINGHKLDEYMKKYGNLPTNTCIMFAYSLAKLIKYLHNNDHCEIIHSDISPNNIIISESGDLYLIDFGSSFESKIIKKEKFYYGTPGYFSPKLKESPLEIDKSVDIYSFAMILKLLEFDKISLESYELYKKCIEVDSYEFFDIDDIITGVLSLVN